MSDGGFEDGGVGGDTVVDVDYDSWGQRMKDSIKGIGFGLFLFFISFVVLFWNEGRAVKRQKDLDEGSNLVVSVMVPTSDTSQYNGELVYLSGLLQPKKDDDNDEDDNEMMMSLLYDPLFGLDITNATNGAALKYARMVETYQWTEESQTETKKTSNGGKTTTTTYSYTKDWSSRLIDSNSFRTPEGHENPTQLLVEPLELQVDPMVLDDEGLFALGVDTARNKVNWWEYWRDIPSSLNLSKAEDMIFSSSSSSFQQQGNRSIQAAPGGVGNGVYIGNSTAYTMVGDTRITFQIILPKYISIVAGYNIDSTNDGSSSSNSRVGRLEPYETSRGGELLLFEEGDKTVEEMFAQAEADNKTTTWLLRIVGFIIMFLGVCLVLQPFAVFVDIIPFIGDFLEEGMTSYIIPILAGLVSIPFTLLTISIAWVFYRPIFLIISLVVLGGLVFMANKVIQAKNEKQEQQQQQQQQEQPTKPEPEKINNEDDVEIAVQPAEDKTDVYVPSSSQPTGIKDSPEWFGQPRG